MPLRALLPFIAALLFASAAMAQESSPAKPLAGIKAVQVDATVVPDAKEVKSEFAPNLVADSLRIALRNANFELAEAPVHAHIVLDKFNSGSAALRFTVGMGAGRSTIEGRLVITDANGKELASRRIKVRGNMAFSPYQGNNTQRRQAVNSFEQKLIEELEGMK